MKCSHDHIPIDFEAGDCPLCQALSDLEAAEADRDYAREEAADKDADLEEAYYDRFEN